MYIVSVVYSDIFVFFFFSSRRRHTRCALVTGVQTCALPIFYYLQTPDFAFPVEPHFRTVGFHWLPEQARAALIQRRGFGFRKKAASVEEAVTNIQSVNLLTKGQMKALFGDAVIFHERFLGLPKSLIAVRE